MTTTTEPQGFFRMQSPIDLLEKMTSDFARVSKAPLDVYAAFDFFVTANHLPDWLSRARCNPGSMDARGRALRRICKQLANGAKHFISDSTVAVQRQRVGGYSIFGSAIFGSRIFDSPVSGGPAPPRLIVDLGPEESAALGKGTMSVVQLAEMVLTYWTQHPMVERARAQIDAENRKGRGAE